MREWTLENIFQQCLANDNSFWFHTGVFTKTMQLQKILVLHGFLYLWVFCKKLVFCCFLYAASVKVSWQSKELLSFCLEEMAPLQFRLLASHNYGVNMQVRQKVLFKFHTFLIKKKTKLCRIVAKNLFNLIQAISWILTGDIQQHLQTMFTLLRPEDNIKLVGAQHK